MPLKPVGITDANTFPGRVGSAISTVARAAVSADLARKLEGITVGTVTTAEAGTPASVTVTGTAPTMALNFVIPKGETGAQGSPGTGGTGGTGSLPWFDATAYGADKSGTNNAAPGIQAAINAAYAVGGGVVYLPAGDYRIIYTANVDGTGAAGGVQLRGNVWLRGDGRATRLFPTGTWTTRAGMIGIGDWANSARNDNRIYNVRVSDLWLKGTKGAWTSGTRITNACGIIFNSYNAAQDAVLEPDAAHSIHDILMWDLDTGLVLRGDDDQAVVVSKVRIRRTLRQGVVVGREEGTGGGPDNFFSHVDQSSGNIGLTDCAGIELYTANTHWTNCKAWYNKRSAAFSNTRTFKHGAGWYIKGTRNTFASCEAQDNGGHGFLFNYGENTFTGCIADSNSYYDTVSGSAKVGECSGFYISDYAGNMELTGFTAFNRSSSHKDQKHGVYLNTTARNVRISGLAWNHYGGVAANGVGLSGTAHATHRISVGVSDSGSSYQFIEHGMGSGGTAPTPEAPTTAAAAAAGGGLMFYEGLAPVVARNLTSGGEYTHSTSSSGQTSRTSRQFFTPAERVSFARLLYQNLSTVRALNTANITVTASVERAVPVVGTAVTTPVRVSFNGATTVTIPPGGSVLSDPVMIDDRDGTGFFIRTCTGANSGAVWPNNGYTRGALYPGEMSWYGDYTGTAATTDGFTGSTVAHGPAAILTLPTTKPTVGVIGDSITQGSGDEGSGEGYWDRWAKTRKARLTRAAVNGELARYILDTTNNRDTLWAQVTGVDWLVCALGTNDVAQWQSESGIKAHWPRVWARMAASSRRGVYQTTIPPYTQSSDGWSTVSGQTLRTFESIRLNLNAWLRSGAPITGLGVAGDAGHPLAGVLDVAPAVEDATGKWKASMTNDGVHPNPAGHAALATRLSDVAPVQFYS